MCNLAANMLAGGQTGSEGGAAPADSLIEEGLANLRGFFMPALKKLLAQVGNILFIHPFLSCMHALCMY